LGNLPDQGLTARERMTAGVVTSLARWTPWLESELCGLRGLVPEGGVCIDVGAAAGLYTAVLSRLAGPAGQVHSVEPLPFAHLFWAGLLNAKGAPNVRHHSLALSTQPGNEPMSVPVGRFGLVTGRSFLSRRADGPDSNAEFATQITVSVPVATLDDLCAREEVSRLDFIKIDVEGAELQVLEGGKGVIDRHRPVMLIEIEARHAARYQRSPDEVSAWLLQRGYTMHVWQNGWRRTDTIEPSTRNYLFRPPGVGPAGQPATAARPANDVPANDVP
jgi:FkbM family methyltransferase